MRESKVSEGRLSLRGKICLRVIANFVPEISTSPCGENGGRRMFYTQGCIPPNITKFYFEVQVVEPNAGYVIISQITPSHSVQLMPSLASILRSLLLELDFPSCGHIHLMTGQG